MGFQVAVVLPVVLFMLAVFAMARRREPPSARGAALVCAILVALALCGGSGLILSAFPALWLACAAREAWKLGRSKAAAVALAGALAVLFTVAICSIGIDRQTGEPVAASLLLVNAAGFLSLSIGPAGEAGWPYSFALVAGLAGAAFLGVLRVARLESEERLRALGAVLGLLAVAAMGAAIALSRTWSWERAGFAQRYVVLATPLVAVAYVAACAPLRGRTGAVLRWSLFGLLLAATPADMLAGERWGEDSRSAESELIAGVEAGQTSHELALCNQGFLLGSYEALALRLMEMRRAKLGPFRRHAPAADPDPPDPRTWPFFMFSEPPRSVSSTQQHRPFLAYGVPVYLVMPDGRVELELPSGTRLLRGRFGLAPQSFELGRTDGVRFRIEARAEADPVVLFERTLDPLNRPEDRGPQQFEIAFPSGARGRLCLMTDNEPGKDGDADGSFWTDVVFVESP
jgi:hypothetical protein